MTPSIRLENISKRYRIGAAGPSYQTLRESLMESLAAPFGRFTAGSRRAASERMIWALENVSCEIAPGEAVGIIGRNGAGKTTLLKILARITEPTSGSAELHGRVGTLLDVGTGFHSELTGRENIYLNGAILGMTRKEVRRKLDRIVEFSGVEQFLDTPIKRYSSGMRVRLAFAIGAHLDTEILLADEVLAVGDVAFQRKCIEEMGSLSRHGRTVLFVSHNMDAVAELCPKSILLEKGRLVGFGRTRDVMQRYLSEFSPKCATAVVEPPIRVSAAVISRVGIADDSGRPSAELDWRLPFSVTVEFQVTKQMPALSVGIALANPSGVRVLCSWIAFQIPYGPGTYQAQGRFPGGMLTPGKYSIEVWVENFGVELHHHAEHAAWFEICTSSVAYGYDMSDYALLYFPMPWEVKGVTNSGPELPSPPVPSKTNP